MPTNPIIGLGHYQLIADFSLPKQASTVYYHRKRARLATAIAKKQVRRNTGENHLSADDKDQREPYRRQFTKKHVFRSRPPFVSEFFHRDRQDPVLSEPPKFG